MKFGIRREINIPGFEESLSGIAGVSIELALPYKIEDYLAGQSLLPAVAAAARDLGVVVQSVHAPQGRLTDPDFHTWALATARFAEVIGAKVIVFHPEESRQDMRVDRQLLAMRNIRQLQRETNVTIAIETFGSKKRILRPEELGMEELPICLDTSHLFVDRIMQLIEKYSKYISCIHLSEARDNQQHMPVESYGFDILDRLQKTGWYGIVTLEYLPEYHDRLLPDLYKLQKQYGG
ncbi:MAG: TIM barrel protein [Nitrospiraceae bacterium]|nr:TIM barrel protein [Nitrospiraceae bacterium]